MRGHTDSTHTSNSQGKPDRKVCRLELGEVGVLLSFSYDMGEALPSSPSITHRPQPDWMGLSRDVEDKNRRSDRHLSLYMKGRWLRRPDKPHGKMTRTSIGPLGGRAPSMGRSDQTERGVKLPESRFSIISLRGSLLEFPSTTYFPKRRYRQGRAGH